MRWLRGGMIVAVSLYLASGFYVVGGNEQAAVRRFGRLIHPLRSSGWHYDLPGPFCRVDRINLTAVRVLTVGAVAAPVGDELLPAARATPSVFLTGDKNLLQFRASVQYRVSEEHLAEFLFAHERLEEPLRYLITAALSDASANAGVDYLHTIGLAELHDWLTVRLRHDAEQARLGIEVDRVTLDGAEPPLRVQADFLDVANARNEAARAAQEARTYAEQRVTAADAEGRQRQDRARQDVQSRMAQARGRSARFVSLVNQIQADAEATGRPYQEGRRFAERRLTLETWKVLLGRIPRPVIVDRRQPVDLQFVPPAN